LPLTSKSCVNLIITDMAVIEVKEDGLHLLEVMTPFTIEDVIKNTSAELKWDETISQLT